MTLRIGFVTGSDRWWQTSRIQVKYLKMRFDGMVYPDTYALPALLGTTCDFLTNGDRVGPRDYDLLMAELNASDSQLDYLRALVEAGRPPVAVIPGPPEIIGRKLNDRKLRLVREILSNAAFVWCYAPSIKTFADGIAGHARAQVIPWPFDAEATRRAAIPERPKPVESIHVLLDAPLRFTDIAHNYPFVLKRAVQIALEAVPDASRSRFRFHSVVYTKEDEQQFHESGFADGLAVTLAPKRQYKPFVRFLAGCDGIVNLLNGNPLGRVTFLAGALGKPGVFSDTSELNRELYPQSTVPLLDPERLSDALTMMFVSLASDVAEPRCKPDMDAVNRIGDFRSNSTALLALVHEGLESLSKAAVQNHAALHTRR